MRVIEFRFYPAPDTLVFGAPFSSLIFWLEPLALLAVCTAWGALLAEKIEVPVAKWVRAQLDRPRPQAPPSGIT